MTPSISADGSRLIFNRNRLDLDHQVRMGEATHFNSSARRQPDPEIFVPNIDMTKELVDIGDKGCRLDQVLQGSACGFEGHAQVFTNLLNLGPHVARPDDIARLIAGQLSGNENQ